MARRWVDEGYDFYAPEEIARRNELYEAFGEPLNFLVYCGPDYLN